MSVYLGNTLVSVTPPSEANTPNLNIRPYNGETWTRPTGWPDLDSLNLTPSGDDYVYMTYDANSDLAVVSLYINGTNIEVTIGYISNGTYIPEETIPVSNTYHYFLWLDNYNGYKVVKVTGNITRFYCYDRTKDTGQVVRAYQQPMLERIAHLPNLTPTGVSAANTWGTYYLEREKLSAGTALTSLGNRWEYCYKLKDLDVSNVDTSNVSSMSSTFEKCYSLQTLDLSNWTFNKVTSFYSTFRDCSSLKELILPNIIPSSNLTSCSYMFGGCEALEELSSLKTLINSQQTKSIDLSYMFQNCYSLKDVSFIKNWYGNNITNMSSMFSSCRSLTNIDLSNLNTSNVTNIGSLFSYCYNLKTIIFPTPFVTNKVTNVSSAFSSCYSLREINGISNWDTSSVTNFNSTFSACYSLRSLNLNSWDTSSATSFSSMFSNCWSLITVGTLSNWDTSEVTNMGSMFQYCYSLQSIPNMTNWDFSKVTSIGSMFSDCKSIKEIILPNLDLSLCKSMSGMIKNNDKLEKVSLGGWTLTSAMTNEPGNFLYQCPNLKDVIGITIPPLYITVQNSYAFTHESLLVILNALPSIATTKTLALGGYNLNRLTTAEKAIATDKGWTLSS